LTTKAYLNGAKNGAERGGAVMGIAEISGAFKAEQQSGTLWM